MAAPYVNMKFMPTGGINAKNLKSYLDFNKIIACGGSWMVSGEMINAGEFDKIKSLTKEAVELMLGFEIAHIGINASNEKEADDVATKFDSIFGFTKKVGNTSVFAGSAIEVMKTPYLGDNGHIAIKTNYIDRAVAYLERNGFKVNTETAKFNDKKKMVAVYLQDEIGGFAIHLLQK